MCWYTIAPAVRWPEDLDKIEPPKLDKAKKTARIFMRGIFYCYKPSHSLR